MAKKKALLGVVCLAMVAMIAVFGTVAYLTDRDAETNVFTSGEVSIDLKEDFEWGAELLPGVPVDKAATVANTGKNDAWVWVTVAVPTELSGVIEITGTDASWTKKDGTGSTVIGEKNYTVYTFLHTNALTAKEETKAAFTAVTLKSSIDVDPNGNWYDVISGTANALEWSDADDNPLIYVAAYAIQKDNFATVDAAYAAYGEQWNGNHNADYAVPVFVSTSEELIDSLAEIKSNAKQIIPGDNGDKRYREHIDIILTEDIEIDGDLKFMYTDGNGAAFHFYGVEGTLDLNGHDIIVTADALMDGKTYANAVLLFQYSDVDIVGDGSIIANNKSIPVYGLANGTVNIYGGTYITNAYERNESAVYVNNASMVINVYGGNFENSEYAFNVHDNCGSNSVLVLHEGVTFAKFLKNGTDVIASDLNSDRIIPADGCRIAIDDDEVWYKVEKE